MKSQINLVKFPKCYLKNTSDDEHIKSLINKRVEISDFVGTVRFIGKLIHKSDPDYWIGVEWDDITRGKHNGTVENVQYFNTIDSNAGSLIKLNKANFGYSFYEAVKFKYNFKETDEIYQFINKSAEKDMFIQTNTRKISIEIVGLEKVMEIFSNLEEIYSIDLTFSYISTIEPDLGSRIPKLTELTLQKTLLSKWSQFLQICINFKNLNHLNFSENILTFDEDFSSLKNEINTDELKLNYLILNKCQMDFNSLFRISFLLKNTKTLYLMGNQLNEGNYESNKESIDLQREASITGNHFMSITFLSLEKNNIKNFIKVYEILSALNLERLNINQNHIIKLIHHEKDLNIVRLINKNIKGLYIDYNHLNNSSETFIDISHFDNLIDLDILNNSFNSEVTRSEIMKCELIGRLLKLQILNNTIINKQERRDSELLYLKDSVNLYIKQHPFNDQKDFDTMKFETFMRSNHPNYFILRNKYFDPLEDILYQAKKLDVNTIKGNIKEVNFEYMGKKIVKKFPKTTTFANLRNLLSKLFKIDGNFNFYIDNQEIIMDETCSLDNYDINSEKLINLK